MAFSIKVNGNTHNVDVDGDTPLLWVLRDVLGMTGTKFGCGMALCGACTVHIDGAPTRSCITSIDSIGDSEVKTIEVIGATAAGAKIQKAWLDREVPQCGYCQSGQIMSAAALLTSNPHPNDTDIDDAMSAISVAAAPMRASTRRSSKQRKRTVSEADNDPRSHRFLRQQATSTLIRQRALSTQFFTSRRGRWRWADTESESVICQRRS
jgi:isoquinoline 1-oxidoreductase subunit alpha